LRNVKDTVNSVMTSTFTLWSTSVIGRSQFSYVLFKIIWCGRASSITLISMAKLMCLPILMNFDQCLLESWRKMLAYLVGKRCIFYSLTFRHTKQILYKISFQFHICQSACVSNFSFFCVSKLRCSGQGLLYLC